MGEKSNTVDAAQEQVKQSRKQAEPTFPIQRLRQNCLALFGVTSSTFDGAACGLKAEKYTVAEMKQHIEKWQKTAAAPKKKEGK